MKKVGIAACSNGLDPRCRGDIQTLMELLQQAGTQVVFSSCIYEKDGPFSGTGRQRAEQLNRLFQDPAVSEIYDISGGDMANEILDFLDFDRIAESSAELWGYSDLTTVMNAIYARTGKSSVLYQIRNLTQGEYQILQQHRYAHRQELFSPSFRMVQGNAMEGTVIGGNIRCFLKLAGTPYFPDAEGKLLLLEARSGGVPQVVTYLSQLRSCGVFAKIRGVILGTFTQLEREGLGTEPVPLLQSFVGREMPIAVTREIGHGADAKAIRIGERLRIGERNMACG